MIVFTVASAMGATPKEVNFAMAFVKFPLARAPLILEALPSGVAICGRLRLPSRSSDSSNSDHSPRRGLPEALHRARLFVSGSS